MCKYLGVTYNEYLALPFWFIQVAKIYQREEAKANNKQK